MGKKSNQYLKSILQNAPASAEQDGTFISYFEKRTNRFSKPEMLPQYLEKCWSEILEELETSSFLQSNFFDYKQLAYGGNVVRFRFWILVIMFIEVGFFLTWVYYAYTNDNFSQKKFVSGYWFQFLFILTFVHTHLILKR